MIDTLFSTNNLGTGKAFFLALVIGVLFGVALERAGFGSSRKLAGIFYFKDMTVLKVMFTALLTAMIGLSYCVGLGFIEMESIFLMPTLYTSQIIGGLLLGIGFVMGGWCPGTAAVGASSGKLDALIFLGGAVLGSILFNELYPLFTGLYENGETIFVYSSLGISKPAFAFLFTLMAVACFWGSEYLEKKRSGTGIYFNTKFLRAFSLILVIAAAAIFLLPEPGITETTAIQENAVASEEQLIQEVSEGMDHVEPEELADMLMANSANILVVDIRPEYEFNKFHIRSAISMEPSLLLTGLVDYKNKDRIVLYSNGMTHPAQARDSLYRQGYQNVYILTDGLQGFIERCLKPVSLRETPVSEEMAQKIKAWRQFFLAPKEEKTIPPEPQQNAKAEAPVSPQTPPSPVPEKPWDSPYLIETSQLAALLGKADVKIIDCRTQPAYNSGHIPGSLFLSPESFRGVVTSVPSMLLPASMIAAHLSLMGIQPTDMVVLVPDDKIMDATLITMGLARVGHPRYAILSGGFSKWVAEQRPSDTILPSITPSQYPIPTTPDSFTVDYKAVLENKQKAIILDVRPTEFFTGQKVDEARGGHIPGAINRPFSQDAEKKENYFRFKSKDELEKAYSLMIPSKDSPVIVHCRTGHQASHTFFVLKSLLGYKNVSWYDGGWTEWAARKELPVVTGEK